MGPGTPPDDLTSLLGRWGTGTTAEQERLVVGVQGELRRVAAAYMRRERGDHTLQPTALVNEAYLRLINGRDVQWEDRAHFFGIAARLMRQILVDHARKRRAGKRGLLARTDRSVSKLADPSNGPDLEMLALHDALTALAALDPRQAEIVELRYFGGLTEEEVAGIKKISPATVRREVAAARFWLGRRMKGER
ncbi:MAG TPA: sigma-70 family RNA polymerase sigma factor [Vicinamibacterales bacterium]|nr:sigma-70 family RNA polymerase sigma factor [Vicinamibacterales bacterium]